MKREIVSLDQCASIVGSLSSISSTRICFGALVFAVYCREPLGIGNEQKRTWQKWAQQVTGEPTRVWAPERQKASQIV